VSNDIAQISAGFSHLIERVEKNEGVVGSMTGKHMESVSLLHFYRRDFKGTFEKLGSAGNDK
jgi:hypothetical protein